MKTKLSDKKIKELIRINQLRLDGDPDNINSLYHTGYPDCPERKKIEADIKRYQRMLNDMPSLP